MVFVRDTPLIEGDFDNVFRTATRSFLVPFPSVRPILFAIPRYPEAEPRSLSSATIGSLKMPDHVWALTLTKKLDFEFFLYFHFIPFIFQKFRTKVTAINRFVSPSTVNPVYYEKNPEFSMYWGYEGESNNFQINGGGYGGDRIIVENLIFPIPFLWFVLFFSHLTFEIKNFHFSKFRS